MHVVLDPGQFESFLTQEGLVRIGSSRNAQSWIVLLRTYGNTGSPLLRDLEYANRTLRWHHDWSTFRDELEIPAGLQRPRQALAPRTFALFRQQTDGSVHVSHKNRLRQTSQIVDYRMVNKFLREFFPDARISDHLNSFIPWD